MNLWSILEVVALFVAVLLIAAGFRLTLWSLFADVVPHPKDKLPDDAAARHDVRLTHASGLAQFAFGMGALLLLSTCIAHAVQERNLRSADLADSRERALFELGCRQSVLNMRIARVELARRALEDAGCHGRTSDSAQLVIEQGARSERRTEHRAEHRASDPAQCTELRATLNGIIGAEWPTAAEAGCAGWNDRSTQP